MVVTEHTLANLRETLVTLDRVQELTDGMDEWAINRTIDATERAIEIAEAETEAERQERIEAEADQLVEAMLEAVEE